MEIINKSILKETICFNSITLTITLELTNETGEDSNKLLYEMFNCINQPAIINIIKKCKNIKEFVMLLEEPDISPDKITPQQEGAHRNSKRKRDSDK